MTGAKKRLLSIIMTAALMCALTVCAFAQEPKLIALTFDDGPNPKYTPALLDGLDERNAKVTFFVMGNSLTDRFDDIVLENAAIVKRAYDAGHQIANHSYSHPHLTLLSDEEVLEEIGKTESALDRILGTGDWMVRPPYGDGRSDPRLEALIDAPLITWTVDPAAGADCTEDELYTRALSEIRDGSIVLLHDQHGMENVNAALRLIDTLRAEGYEFVTVEELFRLRGVRLSAGHTYAGAEDLTGGPDPGWASVDIAYVLQNGLMRGSGNGFDPNGHMTRAMAASVIHRLFGSPAPEGGAGDAFSDISGDEWYAPAVAWCAERGYVTGFEDGTFLPGDEVTREQFYVVAARVLGLRFSPCSRIGIYTDDDRISPWARESVSFIRSGSADSFFRSGGFRSKNDVELFRPQSAMTRAECAELIRWMAQYLSF